MKYLIIVGFLVLCVGSTVAFHDHYKHSNVVCFWNSTSFERDGLGKFEFEYFEPALHMCTHLVYGYVGINAENHEVVSLHPYIDTGAGWAFYRRVTQLKKSFPALKIYLSIGGNADPYEETHKYLTLTETPEARSRFINSVSRLLADYEFDGIDLAWQFPEAEVKKNRSALGSMWRGMKNAFGGGKFKDKKEAEHRDGFSILVRDLEARLRPVNKALTLTVLPNVNASVYYDVRSLALNIDAVHLMTFDQKTPERNPHEADHPASMYTLQDSITEDNIEVSVSYWLNNGLSASKIVVGIPTFARTWKLESANPNDGILPIAADGPGAEGPLTKTPGFLSYTEVCALLREKALVSGYGIYNISTVKGPNAYRPYDPMTGADGIWIGYENPGAAEEKALYAIRKDLGGIAIFDLSTDDFRGIWSDDKFPILRAVKNKLLSQAYASIRDSKNKIHQKRP